MTRPIISWGIVQPHHIKVFDAYEQSILDLKQAQQAHQKALATYRDTVRELNSHYTDTHTVATERMYDYIDSLDPTYIATHSRNQVYEDGNLAVSKVRFGHAMTKYGYTRTNRGGMPCWREPTTDVPPTRPPMPHY